MIYLDTHVVVWLYGGIKERLSKKAARLINEEFIAVSPIINMELKYLYEVDKISVLPDKVLSRLYKDIGLTVVTCDLLELIKLALNQSWTRDPFDRLISAQAILDNAKLLTKDQDIINNCNLAVWE